MSRTPVPSRCRRLLLGLALVVSLTGCGAGEPRSIGPAGVDGLLIPTSSPARRDFVRVVDNPYLPLTAGSEWFYQRSEGGVIESFTVSVSGTRTIEGVTTTEVTTVVDGTGGSVTSRQFFAQDREGNVWSFGGDDWTAGTDGAQAGLVMPATPRVGDGFLQQYAPGVAEDRSQVLDTAASVTTTFGSWTDVVEVLETSDVPSPTETTLYYAPGVGLVLAESGATRTELEAHGTAENPVRR
jgi:hypothetical protein